MMARVALFSAAMLALAQCSSLPGNEDPLVASLTALTVGDEQRSPRFAALIDRGAPTLQVGLLDRDVSTSVLLERTDGAFTYWLTLEGAQFIFQSGMLHGTRGLGEGLLASELSEPIARVLGRQPGPSVRFHTYLDGNDRAVTRTYRCLIDTDGTRQVQLATGPVNAVLMTESCRSLDQEFLNFYWVVPSTRQIVQSRQWAGPEIGPVSTRVVPR